jgi:hypothetical protein
VGDDPVLRVGAAGITNATLAIDSVDSHGIHGRLSIDQLVADGAVVSLPGAEADALAHLSFGGAPLRVYLAFVALSDGGGEALVITALYDDRRVEVRVLRGGPLPIYAIFALSEGR